MTLAAAVAEALGCAVLRVRILGGTRRVEVAECVLESGARVVAKRAVAPGAGLTAEAEGLRLMHRFGRAASGAWVGPRVPDVLIADHRLLVMEHLDLRAPPDAGDTVWGRALARLHRRSSQRMGSNACRFGFEHDGVLGATPQSQARCDHWIDFWRCQRLRPMLELFEDPGVRRLGDQIDGRLDLLLEGACTASCLIHGDLWSGNVGWVLDRGSLYPATFDPSACFASREADLGMTRWMGGFSPSFEAAYREVWPLPPNADRRIRVYTLHHHLNHLHLFGSGYRRGCVSLMERILADVDR